LIRNVMTTPVNPRPHAFDVELQAGQAHVPDINFYVLRCGLREETRNGISAKGGLKGKIETLVDRPL
jgi:hypothetical protein